MQLIETLKNNISNELSLKEAFMDQQSHFVSSSVLSCTYALSYFSSDNTFVKGIVDIGVSEMHSTVALPFSLAVGVILLSVYGLAGGRPCGYYTWQNPVYILPKHCL